MIATSRATIFGKMSIKSYCEGSSNDVVVSEGQHGQPQPLIHVEFVITPVSTTFSIIGKERKRQFKRVTQAFHLGPNRTNEVTSSGFEFP